MVAFISVELVQEDYLRKQRVLETTKSRAFGWTKQMTFVLAKQSVLQDSTTILIKYINTLVE